VGKRGERDVNNIPPQGGIDCFQQGGNWMSGEERTAGIKESFRRKPAVGVKNREGEKNYNQRFQGMKKQFLQSPDGSPRGQGRSIEQESKRKNYEGGGKRTALQKNPRKSTKPKNHKFTPTTEEKTKG